MKRCLGVVAVLVALAGSAHAVQWHGSQGGVVYWNLNAYASNAIELWRFEFDNSLSYIAGTNVNFDNVPWAPTAPLQNELHLKERNCEVFDPRVDGGQGRLLVASVIDNFPPATSDVVLENPSTLSQNVIVQGRKGGSGTWETTHLTHRALATPPNWGGKVDYGISVTTWDWNTYQIQHHFDADGSGTCDNGLTEERNLTGGGQLTEVEFEVPWRPAAERDRSVYQYEGGAIRRTTEANLLTTYYNFATGYWAATKQFTANSTALAVGPSHDPAHAAPIVYSFVWDNVLLSGGYAQMSSIYAFQDLNNDNVITSLDRVARVWCNGDYGFTMFDNGSYGQPDLELDPVSNTLLWNSPWGGFWAVALADNGLASVEGKQIASAFAYFGPTGGFELDMTPIPEPGTLLLLGTGRAARLRLPPPTSDGVSRRDSRTCDLKQRKPSRKTGTAFFFSRKPGGLMPRSRYFPMQ